MKELKTETLESLVCLAEDAGRIIMKSDRKATKKQDGTDVTPADIQSHEFLTEGIRKIMGADAKILSEEGKSAPPDIQKGISIIIDPLDGTTNFKNGKRNFSVLLAVLKDGVPVFGVAVAPAYGLTACGGTLMKTAELRLHAKHGDGPYRLVRRLQPFDKAADLAIVPKRFIGSKDPDELAVIQGAMAAFKERVGKITFEGSANIFSSLMPVFKKDVGYRVYEAVKPNQKPGDWDLAAWDAILRGVGGIMTSSNGTPLRYGIPAEDFKHQGFICWRKESEARVYASRPATTRPSAAAPSL